jgi:hypothetical protein
VTEPIVYTNQTALNKIWSFAQTQKVQSNKGTSCLYNSKTKSGEDNHCWVGALLEGVELQEEDNNRDVESLMGENIAARDRLEGCDLSFLRACQSVHDDPNNWDYHDSVDERMNGLKKVAVEFGLKVPEETS